MHAATCDLSWMYGHLSPRLHFPNILKYLHGFFLVVVGLLSRLCRLESNEDRNEGELLVCFDIRDQFEDVDDDDDNENGAEYEAEDRNGAVFFFIFINIIMRDAVTVAAEMESVVVVVVVERDGAAVGVGTIRRSL